ncbi:MAG: FeoA family protein [Deltaproteobacteria bacterium]|nr:FeoA family protein [Deltaproteobacteria bacterium]
MMTLGLVSCGERCEIVEVRHCGGCGGNCHDDKHKLGHARGGKQHSTTRAEEMGLRAGKRVEMLKNDGNLLLLLVDDARIAIDRRMAMKIMVRRTTDESGTA